MPASRATTQLRAQCQQAVGRRQQGCGCDRGGPAAFGVRHPPGQVGGQHARHARQAEEPDDGVAVPVGGSRQQEGECGPQHAEGGEGASPQEGASAQHGLVDQQAQGRGDEAAVGHVRSGRLCGQHLAHDQREPGHEPRRDPVDGPPPGRLGDQPAHRAGQQDPEKEAGHDPGHHPASSVLRRQVGRERDHDLSRHRGAAHGDGTDFEEPEGGSRCAQHEGTPGTEKEGHGQATAGVQVAQGDHHQQPGGVADLGDRHHRGHGCRANAEAVRHVVQQRLGVIEVGDRQHRWTRP